MLDRINRLSAPEAFAAFLHCCGSPRWAEAMTAHRPFASDSQLFATADQLWRALARADWLEAFAAHPKIGDPNLTAAPAKEQAGVVGAAEEVLRALAEGNRQYEARFGYGFIVCATGKTAAALLALLQTRLNHDPDTELLVAAEEQRQITRLRLEKL